MRRIEADGSTYRRGVVLGLTMAEAMLLLLFCLLIALTALLASERKKFEEVQLRAEAAEALLAEIEKKPPQGSSEANEKLDRYWRHLVANNGWLEKLKAVGLDPEKLVEQRGFLAKVLPLAVDHSGEDVVEAVAFAEALKDQLSLPSDGQDRAEATLLRLERAEAAAVRAERRAAALEEDLAGNEAALAARPGRRVDLPPILTLREEGGFYFETNSAVLSPAFAEKLHEETAARLAALIAAYDVDVIEVIGHTDERPVMSARESNLDKTLLDAVRGGPIAALKPADNAGLGLARAVAVAQVLRADPRLKDHQILPLSAAQLIDTSGTLTSGTFIGDVRERRRIEIRLRRSHEGTNPDSG